MPLNMPPGSSRPRPYSFARCRHNAVFAFHCAALFTASGDCGRRTLWAASATGRCAGPVHTFWPGRHRTAVDRRGVAVAVAPEVHDGLRVWQPDTGRVEAALHETVEGT